MHWAGRLSQLAPLNREIDESTLAVNVRHLGRASQAGLWFVHLDMAANHYRALHVFEARVGLITAHPHVRVDRHARGHIRLLCAGPNAPRNWLTTSSVSCSPRS